MRINTTELEVLENRGVTKILLRSAFASSFGATTPKQLVATVREYGGSDCTTNIGVAIISPMADHIITPKQTRLEKIKAEVKGFSPQVKQAIIMASVTMVIALITSIGGCISIYSENSRLKTKVHDLELEVLPFRNLAVQQFNKADAESLKRLADSMATLHHDYSNQLGTINSLRHQIDQLRKASESLRTEVARDRFKPFSTDVRAEFIKRLEEFQSARPLGLTNLQISIDTTSPPGSADRKSFIQEIYDCLSESRCSANIEGGTQLGGPGETTIFYRADFSETASMLAYAFSAISKTPITKREIRDKRQINLYFHPDLLFETNGMVVFR